MLNNILQKNKNVVFVCSITESFIKVIKCISKGLKREIVGLEIESLLPDTDDKKLTKELSQLFLKLGYSNNPIILSLPRSQVTCRNLKIPSLIPQEIERISNLQASHYLPYSTDELITSFQLIQADKDGYSNIILIIAHKDVVTRYINILKELKPAKINIIPSSNGLANLYNYVLPDEPGPVMIVDVDYQLVELVITSREKLLFGRSFRLTNYADWETLFVNEINKTKDAYLKEISKEAPRKIIFVGPDKIISRCQEIINKQGDIPAEIFSYAAKVKFPKNIADKILSSDNSFASLIGLGLKDAPATLNLLPRDMKEKENKNLQIKEYFRLASLIAAIILIWAVAIAKNMDNKGKYLQKMRAQLVKISHEAKPLEEIEKKFKILEDKSQRKSSSLDLLHELYQVMPGQISLTNLNYEEDNKVMLRGQTAELNSVLAFVSGLDRSQVFKKFNIKMRYATQKKTQAGEVVSFEINCTKK